MKENEVKKRDDKREKGRRSGCLFSYSKFGTPLPLSGQLLGDIHYTFVALHGFVVLDFFLLCVFTLNEWILRFVMVRQRRFENLSGWLRLKFAMGLSQPIIGLVAFLAVYFGFIHDIGKTLDIISVYYLAFRLTFSIIPEFFPFSPLIDTSKKKRVFWSWKGLRKRYVARLAFMILLTAVSMIYEFGLIVPAIDLQFRFLYCGDSQFNYQVGIVGNGAELTHGSNTIFGVNTQHLICLFSTAFMWFISIVAVLIDNGLAFITVMAFVGWIRGFKTQGTARATIQIDIKELHKKIDGRFIKKAAEGSSQSVAHLQKRIMRDVEYMEVPTESPKKKIGASSERRASIEYPPTTSATPISTSAPSPSTLTTSPGATGTGILGEPPKVSSSSASVPTPSPLPSSSASSASSAAPSPPPAAPSDDPFPQARELWNWIVEYYRNLDLISDKEREYLRNPTGGQKIGGIVDFGLLGSPDAQKHLSFFGNTLDVLPLRNYSFFDIPPTTILIPCYSERLEFDWVPAKSYNPYAEFTHLVAKYPHEWLNMVERLQREKRFDPEALEELETWIGNRDMTKEDQKIVRPVTDWLTMHDQYVEKTVRGACSYYDALVQLGIREAGLSEAKAKVLAKEKLQVILCMQIYQKRHKETAAVLAKWLKEFPCFNVVIDYNAKEDTKPEEFNQVPKDFAFATCLLQYDPKVEKVVFKHVIPREKELRIGDMFGNFIQGKAMNQINGLTFLQGRFIQVLDANQGGHAPEYLKFPSLLRDFKLHPQTGDIRYRIIGSREYIFTKNLGTVARCHAYQEWSFGTLVLRTYSDLGIRLHYGHPDVFHGPWAYAHSGLSKVNPDINTSEDVFAGFEAMKCNENTKHLEHIQFHKGRETGLASMSMFDTKISQGNSGILRSRDMYHLMERLDSVTGFLLFQGVSGHFTTISLMMWSMKLYVMCIFLVTLSGASLKSFGNITYATEWLFHAGLTTIIPLVVEFLVEYGPIIGLLRTLVFLPASTMIYLFQMQTKHHAFLRGIFTGKASHINTGRGLAIYRTSMVELFKNYANTHIFPIFYVVALTVGYKTQSGELGGGTLPLIMIYFLCASVILVPQLFNPALTGNSLREAGNDYIAFLSWIGKSETKRFLQDWATPFQQKQENAFLTFWTTIDYELLSTSVPQAIRNLFYHLIVMIFWTGVSMLLVYPMIQYWLVFFLSFWWLSTILYFVIFYVLKEYEAPLRIIIIYIGGAAGMGYFFFRQGEYGVLSFSEMFIAFMLFIKVLESWRAFILDLAVLSSFAHYKSKDADDPNLKKTTAENREKYVSFMLHVINKMFLVNFGRVTVALVWGTVCFIISLVLFPYIANMFLFGDNVNSKHFNFLRPLRKLRQRQSKFGVNV